MTMDHANDTDPAVFAAVLTELKHDARTPVKEVIEINPYGAAPDGDIPARILYECRVGLFM